MAATSESGGDATDPLTCSSAREFALERLAETERPQTPQGLASEYGCGGDHMRHVLADHVEEGNAERVARGKYVAAEEEAVETSEEIAEGDAESTEETMSTEAEYQRQQDMVTPEISDEERAESPAEVDGEGSEEDGVDGESSGSFSDVSPEMALLFSLVVFAVVVWLHTRGGQESDGGDLEDESEEEQQDDSTVPLLEG